MVQKTFLKTVQSITVVVISQFLFSRVFRSRSHSKRDIYLDIFCSRSKGHASINIRVGLYFRRGIVMISKCSYQCFCQHLTCKNHQPSVSMLIEYTEYSSNRMDFLSKTLDILLITTEWTKQTFQTFQTNIKHANTRKWFKMINSTHWLLIRF